MPRTSGGTNGRKRTSAAQRRHEKARHGSAGNAREEETESASADGTSLVTASIGRLLSSLRISYFKVTSRASEVLRVGAVSLRFFAASIKCVKNRFGERMIVTIRPDFDEGTFEVTDSPAFTQQANDLDKLRKIIEETPGQSQNAIYKRSGMKKVRLVEMLKAGKDSLWEEQPAGNSLMYFPTVPKTGNNLGNKGTGQGVGDCSPVPMSLDGNREQAPLLTQST
jgi:hypothetical protein